MLRVYVPIGGADESVLTVKEASLMRRIIMLLAAAAFMAVMMVASATPAMANHLFNNDLDNFGVLNDNDLDNLGRFDNFGRFGNFGRFDDDEDLHTIRVGDLRCLVEDRDDVKFCVNKDTGEIIRNF
jgi:hypothetical protein